MAQPSAYENLFGSSSEESGNEEEEEEEEQHQAPASLPQAAAAKPASAPTGGDSSSSEEESEDDDGDAARRLSAKKRLQKKGVALASSSSESEDSDDEAEGPSRPPAKARVTGSDALARATAEFDDEEEEEADRRPKPQFMSEESSSSSSSGGEESDSDDEGDFRRRKRGGKKKKTKRISKGGAKEKKAKAPKPKRDDDDVDGGGGGSQRRGADQKQDVVTQALNKMKKRSQKLPDKAVQEMTERLIGLMETAAKEDRLAMANNKPAVNKVAKLNEVLDLLKSKHLQGALVDNAQLLGLIKQWLQPLPDKSLPMYAVRTPLIEYLVTARVEVHRLKESGIGAIIQKLQKHKDETVANKAKLTEIIDNWSRLITGKGTTLKARTTEDMEGRTHSEMQHRGSGGGGSGSGYIVSTTARGVVIPYRTGFNFEKVALTFKEEFDRGQGKDDEALEVMERGERGDGVENRATRVRKALKDMSRGGSKKLRHESVKHGHH